MFDRRRALVGTTKHGRMISLGSVLTLVAVFTAGAQERRHYAAAVGAVDPAALGAELEFSKFRLRSDMADGGKQLRCVDAIAWGRWSFCSRLHDGQSHGQSQDLRRRLTGTSNPRMIVQS